MNKTAKILLLQISVFLSFSLAAYAKEIIVYHTSDTHGYFFEEKNSGGKPQGGFAALSAFINKDSAGAQYLLLDGGDILKGNLEVNDTKGAAAAPAFNALGYTAVTLGNNDFDYEDSLAAVLPGFKADILLANYEGVPGAKPYKIYLIDGVKIAVIGIGLNDAPLKIYKEKDKFESYKKAIKQVYAEGANAVILLAHASNYDMLETISPKDIVNSAPYEVQLALGGHAHANKIEKFKNTLYAESGEYAQHVSKIILDFDDDTNAFKGIKAKNYPLLLDKYGQDAEVKNIVDAMRNPAYEKIVCNTGRCLRYAPAQKGRLDTDLGRLAAKAVFEKSEGDFAMINTISFRADIPQGAVSQRSFLKSMRYDSKIARVKLNGKFIYNFIAGNIREDFSAFQFYGLTIRAEFEDTVLNRLDIKIQGKPLDFNKEYTVISNEYIIFGGANAAEGFGSVRDDKKERLMHSMRQAVLDAFGNNPNAKPPKSGVIRINK